MILSAFLVPDSGGRNTSVSLIRNEGEVLAKQLIRCIIFRQTESTADPAPGYLVSCIKLEIIRAATPFCPKGVVSCTLTLVYHERPGLFSVLMGYAHAIKTHRAAVFYETERRAAFSDCLQRWLQDGSNVKHRYT